VLLHAKSNDKINLVGDADFNWFLSNSGSKKHFILEIKEMSNRVVLTPNLIEF